MDFTNENYIEQIKKFQINVWSELMLEDKEKLMQWIVDYKAAQFGYPSLCNVSIRSLNDPSKKGLFVSKTGDLIIEKDLAVNGLKPPYRKNGLELKNVLSNKETFETLMHELRHAIQEYERQSALRDGFTSYSLLMCLNHEYGQNSHINAYFKATEKDSRSVVLYMIQPTERDAFLFADKECREFNELMHSLFPSDEAFSMHDTFSAFNDAIQDAMILFETSEPFEDIDKILKSINGLPIDMPLNNLMYDAVQETQKKSWPQRIKESILKTNDRTFNIIKATDDIEPEAHDLGNR
jgi:hypothetical protein